MHNLVAINPNLYLIPQTTTHTCKTSPLHFQTFSTRTDYYKFSFFPHTVTCSITTLCCSSYLFGSVQNPGPKHHSITYHFILYIFFLLALIYIYLALFHFGSSGLFTPMFSHQVWWFIVICRCRWYDMAVVQHCIQQYYTMQWLGLSGHGLVSKFWPAVWHQHQWQCSVLFTDSRFQSCNLQIKSPLCF